MALSHAARFIVSRPFAHWAVVLVNPHAQRARAPDRAAFGADAAVRFPLAPKSHRRDFEHIRLYYAAGTVGGLFATRLVGAPPESVQ